jgi:hypothetical protein
VKRKTYCSIDSITYDDAFSGGVDPAAEEPRARV